MQRVIFTADDFGMSASVNSAIVKGHREGLLTHASLMVNGDAFLEAVELAKAHPDLRVGLHLTLVKGRATLPPSEIPDLVDAGGNFSDHPPTAGVRYFFRRGARAQLRRELRAQCEKFLATGLTPSHLDGHCHLHMHPSVWPIAVALAKEYGFQRIRLPREPLRRAFHKDGVGRRAKLGYGVIFSLLCSRALRHLTARAKSSPHRLKISQQVYGVMHTGAMNEQRLNTLLGHLPKRSGVFEIYLHPDTCSTPENPNGPAELAALISKTVRARFDDAGLHLMRGAAAEALVP